MTTKIEWLQRQGTIGESWSPVTGCSPISEGCRNCWAERMSHRLAGRCGYPDAPHQFDVTLHPDRLEQPLRWREPRTIFMPSMGDLFHRDVPSDYVDRVISTITRSPRHTYICLTKRASAMAAYFNGLRERIWVVGEWIQLGVDWSPTRVSIRGMWPIKNLWLGVSAENQETAEERIEFLLDTPAHLRFVSAEPMLGPLELGPYLHKCEGCGAGRDHHLCGDCPGTDLYGEALDWVICGGESGPGARPMNPEWAQGLRDQCEEADVPFFFKQWGAWFPRSQWEHNPDLILPDDNDCWDGEGTRMWPGDMSHAVGKKRAGRILDGLEWNQWPR